MLPAYTFRTAQAGKMPALRPNQSDLVNVPAQPAAQPAHLLDSTRRLWNLSASGQLRQNPHDGSIKSP